MRETETAQKPEKVILIGVDLDNTSGMTLEESLDELEELAKTAGAEVVGRLTQNREAVHPGHYIGKGKAEELKDLISLTEADGVICDDELTSSQMKNLSEQAGAKIMDRTMLILDIFSQRAQSAEGKIQVELAQQKYNLSHLIGLGKSLSRQGGGHGGGIGARRGGGEKKLELDRRTIKERISILNHELKEIRQQRKTSRDRRTKTSIPVMSLIGYTNAGKSTLMNRLTAAGVMAEDKLFATLDTTTRKMMLPSRNSVSGGEEVLLTDTVGFIQKLPHTLIEAFRATLEELDYADVLLHIVDSSNPACDKQMEVVYSTIDTLKLSAKPVLTVFNKLDKLAEPPICTDERAKETVAVSAVTGEGIDKLLAAALKILQARRCRMVLLIPYADGRMLSLVHDSCEILTEEHREDGTYLELYAEENVKQQLVRFMV